MNFDLTRIPQFYHGYINRIEETDLIALLQRHQVDSFQFFDSIPDDKWDFRYAEGKWSIKELVQHVIDAERIFAYRALRFARKDQTPLPGFDEDDYAPASKAERRTKNDLVEELKCVTTSTVLLFKSFDEEMMEAEGMANNNKIYVRGIGFVIVGHALHHVNVVKQRYLKTIES